MADDERSRETDTDSSVSPKSKSTVARSEKHAATIVVGDPLGVISRAEALSQRNAPRPSSVRSAPPELGVQLGPQDVQHSRSEAQLPPPPPPPVVTPASTAPSAPIQFPADSDSLSESKVLEKAWELVVLYGADFVVASTSSQSTKLATIGRPNIPTTDKRPVSKQTKSALEFCDQQHTHPEDLHHGLVSLANYRKSLRAYYPSKPVLDLYRIKKSGIPEVPPPSQGKEVSISGPTFREMQRRSAYTSDAANFLSMISQAMNVLVSKDSLTDEQAGHLKSLLAAQCILSRDLSMLSVSTEVDLNHLVRKQSLARSTLDSSLQEQLLTLPVCDRHLFEDTAAKKMVTDFTTSPVGLLSTIAKSGTRFQPYSRNRQQQRRRQPAATATSGSGQKSLPQSQPLPSVPGQKPSNQQKQQASRPFRGKRRGSNPRQ